MRICGGIDTFHFRITGHPQGEVQHHDTEVKKYSTAGFVFMSHPAALVGKLLQPTCFNVKNFTQIIVFDEAPENHCVGAKTIVHPHHDFFLCLLRGIGDGNGFKILARDRLFDEDVFFCIETCNGNFFVRICRDADIDGVEFFRLKHFLYVGIITLDAVFFGKSPCAGPVFIAHTRYCCIGNFSENRKVKDLRDPT